MNGGTTAYFALLDRLLDGATVRDVPEATSPPTSVPTGAIPADRSGQDDHHAVDDVPPPEFRSTYITDPSELVLVINRLRGRAALALDFETARAGPSAPESTALDPHAGKVRLVTVAAEVADGITEVQVIDGQSCPAWAAMLKPVFEYPGTTIVAHNAKFEVAWLLKHTIAPAGVSDTLLAAQILDGGEHLGQKGYFTLASVVERELGWKLDKTLQTSDWGAAELSVEQLDYAAKDAVATLLLHHRLRRRLAAEQLIAVTDLENAALVTIAWLEFCGAPFDAQRWVTLSDEPIKRKLILSTEIAALLGRSINLNAPKQIKSALGDLGIVVENTEEASLVAVVNRHPVV
jgi:DNA polymerase I-like protein with 3'-5' exonuclease and polymerase domains